jgi:glycosyltransferase involved in cell wall biosynthesis
MRILHVIDRFHLGGSEEHTTNLAVGLSERNHQCEVVAVRRPDRVDNVGAGQKSRLLKAGIPFAEIGGLNVAGKLFLTPLKLLWHIRQFKPDLVQTNTDIPDLMVSLALRLHNFQVVRTIHNFSLWENRPRTGRICELGYGNDLIVAVSQGALAGYRALRDRYGLAQSSHQSIVFGSVPEIPENSRLTRSYLVKNFGADDDKLLLCFAGRLVEQKGFDTLFEAVSGMERELFDKFELHVFTAGEGLDSYQRRSRERQLPLLFHEPVAQIANLFPAFDGILMPSRPADAPAPSDTALTKLLSSPARTII